MDHYPRPRDASLVGGRRSRGHACGHLSAPCEGSTEPPAEREREGGLLHAVRDSRSRAPVQASRCSTEHDGIHSPVLKHGPRSLTSVRVIYLHGMWHTERAAPRWGCVVRLRPLGGCSTGRVRAMGLDVEPEHICWDPKGGDLCLNRMKPRETLVEVRSDVDVQITRLIWV